MEEQRAPKLRIDVAMNQIGLSCDIPRDTSGWRDYRVARDKFSIISSSRYPIDT